MDFLLFSVIDEGGTAEIVDADHASVTLRLLHLDLDALEQARLFTGVVEETGPCSNDQGDSVFIDRLLQDFIGTLYV